MRLNLSLLGTPQVGGESASVAFTRRRAVALLAYLVSTGIPHSREHLADLLGDSANDPHLQKHLSNALAELRQKVGAHIAADRHLVSIADEAELVSDVAVFE